VHGHQILAVAAVFGALRKLVKLIQGDIAEPEGYFFRASDPHALTLFEDLYVLARLQQG
jgi:hypothetical protein